MCLGNPGRFNWTWLDLRSRMQEAQFNSWLANTERTVSIELGAGTAIPSISRLGERMSGPLIRINKRESGVARAQDVSIALGAAEALKEIRACLAQLTA